MARVLIVDDDPVQLRLTAEIARRAGFAPETATGGDQALSLLRADPGFGAVILDLVMPTATAWLCSTPCSARTSPSR